VAAMSLMTSVATTSHLSPASSGSQAAPELALDLCSSLLAESRTKTSVRPGSEETTAGIPVWWCVGISGGSLEWEIGDIYQ
jgi:hypothetical protein